MIFLEHVRGLEELLYHYDEQAREFHHQRDQKRADLALTKRKLVQKEVRQSIQLCLFTSFSSSSCFLLFRLDRYINRQRSCRLENAFVIYNSHLVCFLL